MGTLDALTKVALTLHNKFGTAATLKQTTTGAYNPATGAASVTVTDIEVFGVPSQYGTMELGDTIEEGDVRFTIAGDAATPTQDDTLVLGAETYRIISIKSQYATDDVAYYELQLRR